MICCNNTDLFIPIFSKDKRYDGSDTLKMIGNDCHLFEDNIEKFLVCFVKDNEEWSSLSCLKLRQVCCIYKAFGDLAR